MKAEDTKNKLAALKSSAPLLPYCLGLFVFALLAGQLLPGLRDIAAALGTAEAFEALRQAQAGAPEQLSDLLIPPGKLIGFLPDISALAGLILLGRISLALAGLQFILCLAGSFFRLLPRLALWLGLAHVLFAVLLLARAAWALWRAPEFYLECLSTPLQNFAGGGFALWLLGAVLLLALLILARRRLLRAFHT